MDLVYFALLIILILLVCPHVVRVIRKRKANVWIISGILSLLIGLLTIFVLNQRRWVIPQQTDVIRLVSQVFTAKNNNDKKYDWVARNFIFVDNSFSNELVLDPERNKGAISTISVTNRQDLINLLNLMKSNDSLIDFAIFSMYIDGLNLSDSFLVKSLAPESLSKKVLLASVNNGYRNSPFGILDKKMFGDIAELGDDEFFSTYTPVRGDAFSLAYLLYKNCDSIVWPPATRGFSMYEKKWGGIELSSFIPHFELTDEHRIYKDPQNDELNTELTGSNYFRLENLVSDRGANHFLITLRDRKQRGLKNIIFLGTFKSTESDIHNTFYGSMHGSTIQLNLFYSLITQQQIVSWVFLLYLFLSMTLILGLGICHAMNIPVMRYRNIHFLNKGLSPANNGPWSKIWYYFKGVLDILFVDELHYWIFALFVFVTCIFWGKIINGFILFLLLQFLMKCIKLFSSNQSAKADM